MNRINKWVFILILTIMIICTSCSKNDDRVKIGAVLPLTGEAAKYGESSKNGIDLAVDQINSKGGINSKLISIIYEDDQASPAKAVSALQKLTDIDKVPAVIGAMPSSGTLAMAPIAEKKKVVLLSPISTNPEITNSGDYIFRNCTSDTYEGRIMGEYAANKMNLKTFAVVYLQNDYGLGLKNIFSETVIKNNGHVLLEEAFQQGETNFRTIITKLKDKKPDAVYIIGYNEMIQFFQQVSELDFHTQFLSAIMMKDQELINKIGKPVNGTVFTSWGYEANSPDENSQKFLKNFMDRYNVEPDLFAAQAYDAVSLIAKAMKESGVKPDQIKSGLYNIRNFSGVSGNTSFDENGDVSKPIDIVKIVDDNFKVIDHIN